MAFLFARCACFLFFIVFVVIQAGVCARCSRSAGRVVRVARAVRPDRVNFHNASTSPLVLRLFCSTGLGKTVKFWENGGLPFLLIQRVVVSSVNKGGDVWFSVTLQGIRASIAKTEPAQPSHRQVKSRRGVYRTRGKRRAHDSHAASHRPCRSSDDECGRGAGC